MIDPALAEMLDNEPEMLTAEDLEKILASTSDVYYHSRVAQVAIDRLKAIRFATMAELKLRDSPRSP